MEYLTPQAQIALKFQKVTTDDITVDQYDRNLAKFTDMKCSLFTCRLMTLQKNEFPQHGMETKQTAFMSSTIFVVV